MRFSKGFSLIELLTTVLIIGVLVSVAAPLYTKVVEKVRSTEAISTLNAIHKNFQTCVMSLNLKECTKVKVGDNIFEVGDLEIEGEISDSSCLESKEICMTVKRWQYGAKRTEMRNNGFLYGYRTDGDATILYTLRLNLNDGRVQCFDGTMPFCESLCNGNECYVE